MSHDDDSHPVVAKLDYANLQDAQRTPQHKLLALAIALLVLAAWIILAKFFGDDH